ncbi:phosphatidylserine/phosphatidylglycerophosphate/cardiolipin synthase family protein [Dongia soli]|uniref:Phospholipase D-like domain-containing protein n=1 Tax=Dongia soli TaxID=600628 RepID=A0ABU5EEI1_9PROT|nr:phospholipase D-like domain-containing protein [Dongia soli]MDY0884774.1 phospholipase D-like domain-containing protein [Dongia soli]
MQDHRAEKVADEPSDDDIAAFLDNAPESPHTALRSLLRNAFSRIADAEFSRGNAARLLCDGPANYPVWLAAIAEAKRVVHLENYIIDDDAVGQQFADALMRAAARGVRCRVLYDWLGCGIRTPRRFWRMLREAGVEVRCYNPPRLSTPIAWISRDHRKLLTVDGAVAFAGGLCISKNWAPDPSRGRAPWRDTAVEIRGPAVRHLEASFADSWAAAGPPLPPEDLPQDLPVAANEDTAEDMATPTVPIGDVPPSQSTDFIGPLDLWVVAGRPDNMGLYRLQQMVASTVKHRLWLADAYFVATTGYVNTLTDAARAGVDVRLLVPGSSDVPLIKALSLAEYRPLLEAGVRVFEWNGPMMHAKTTVADSCWARVGSSNSNLASWISNRELDITIDDRVFARAMEAMYLRDLRNCTEIVLQAGKVRPGGGYVADEEEDADLPPAPAGQATTWPQHRPNPIGRGSQRANAGRLLAGTIGAGSSIGASLSQHRALTSTEARVIAVGGLVLVGLALLAVLAPKLIAYPLAVIAVWIGIALLLRAWRLHFASRPAQGHNRSQHDRTRSSDGRS